MIKKHSVLANLLYAAICLALCMLLPFLTGQIPQIGNMLLPMHLPVFLCGFLCGPIWGFAVGLIAPLLRFVIFGMPILYPTALAMAAELAAYGALSGLFFRLLPKKAWALYLALFFAMIGGRIVWGLTQFALLGFSQTAFPFSTFLAGAVTNGVPGIIVQFLLLPPLLMDFLHNGVLPKED